MQYIRPRGERQKGLNRVKTLKNRKIREHIWWRTCRELVNKHPLPRVTLFSGTHPGYWSYGSLFRLICFWLNIMKVLWWILAAWKAWVLFPFIGEERPIGTPNNIVFVRLHTRIHLVLWITCGKVHEKTFLYHFKTTIRVFSPISIPSG